MIIGVPKEIKANEYRAGIVPSGVRLLSMAGHHVYVQKDVGRKSGIEDEEYIKVGATVLQTLKDVYDQAEMIVKVKEPLPDEIEYIKEDQIIFTFLHLAADAKLTHALVERKCIGIAYETIQLNDNTLPLLTPMSEIAGKLSVQAGSYYLESINGGSGVLLGGVPGIEKGTVTIIGGGVAGSNAAKIAVGMGANVFVLDTNHRRLAYLEEIFGNTIRTIASDHESIARLAAISDILVGAVLIPGSKAPCLVTRKMISSMKPGSVVVDISIDQGGCFETSKPTTHENPVYIVNDVIHYCVANIPSVVGRTSTFALTNATLPYVLEIANKGIKDAILGNVALEKGVNTFKGEIVHSGVAEATGDVSKNILKLIG